MKAIVTGATGLVGYHVVDLLLKDKEFTKVLALGRNKERLAELNELGAIAQNFDLTSEEAFELLNDWGEETVWFHCAAAVSGADKPVLHAVNVDGTERLVRKAENLNVPKFVHVSSIAVYGIQDKDYVEDDEFKPESNYGWTKLEAENIVTSSKLNYTVFRPPYIGGPKDNNVLVEFSRRIHKKSMPLITKDGRMGYIDARDLANIMIISSKTDKSSRKIYNAQNAGISQLEFVNMIGRLEGLEPPYGKKYPYSVVITIGTINSIIAKILGKSSERGISRYRIRSLSTIRTVNTTKVIKELGFSPKYDIETSIKDWITSKE